jgi:hypothetical protein
VPRLCRSDATAKDVRASGGAAFFIASVPLFVRLAGLVTVLQKMKVGMSTSVISKAKDIDGCVKVQRFGVVCPLFGFDGRDTLKSHPAIGEPSKPHFHTAVSPLARPQGIDDMKTQRTFRDLRPGSRTFPHRVAQSMLQRAF